MLFSTKNLIPKLEEWNKEVQEFTGQGFESDPSFKEGVKFVVEKIIGVLYFSETENSQSEKPLIFISEKDSALVLYADEDLWNYIQELRKNDFSKFALSDAAKMWMKLKEILKKETKVI